MTINIPDNIVNKVSVSQLGAIILGVCGFIAGMPDSISNQIPQFFPEKYRGYIAPILLTAAYVVHNYGGTAKIQAAQSSAKPQPGAIQPTINKV